MGEEEWVDFLIFLHLHIRRSLEIGRINDKQIKSHIIPIHGLQIIVKQYKKLWELWLKDNAVEFHMHVSCGCWEKVMRSFLIKLVSTKWTQFWGRCCDSVTYRAAIAVKNKPWYCAVNPLYFINQLTIVIILILLLNILN